MLRPQYLYKIRMFSRLLKTRKKMIFFELFMIIFYERPDNAS